MNLIIPRSRVNFFFFLLVFLYTPFHADAVSFFPTFSSIVAREFCLPDRFSSNIIHDVAIDRRGSLYISSPGYLWIYNSGKWHSIQMNSTPEIAVTESGKVYISSLNLLYQVHIQGREFILKAWNSGLKIEGTIRDLVTFYDNVLVVTQSSLFLPEINKLLFLDTLHGNSNFFPLKDGLIIQDEKGTRILDSSLQLSTFSEFHQQLAFLLDHPGGYLVVDSTRQGISVFSREFELVESIAVKNTDIQDIIQLNENQYVVLFENSKIAFLDKGKLIPKQLQDHFPYSFKNPRLYKSPFAQVWIIEDGKLFTIQYAERIEKIKTGLNTEILDIYTFNNQTVLQTQKGLHKLYTESCFTDSQSVDAIFSLEENVYMVEDLEIEDSDEKPSQISARIAKGKLIGHQKDGVSLFLDNDSIHIYRTLQNDYICGFFMDPSLDPSYDLSRYKFIFPRLFFIGEDIINVLDLTTEKPKKLQFPSEFKKGSEISMLTIGDTVYFFGEEAIYQFHSNDETFSKVEPELPSFLKFETLKALGDNYIIGKVSNRTYPGIFFIYDLKNETTELFNIPSFPVSYAPFIVGDLESYDFLLSFQDQLFKVRKLYKQYPLLYSPLIQFILAGSDTLYEGPGFDTQGGDIQQRMSSISFENNKFHLKLGIPDFLDEILALQFKLNHTENWSHWIQGNELNLFNLRSGDYSLTLRTMNPTGRISEECRIEFKILRPFLLSTLAILIYSILILIFLFILYRRIVLIRHNLPVIDTVPDKMRLSEPTHEAEPAKYDLDGIRSPEDIKRKARWDKYEMVTVLFSDIEGFTRIAEEMNPERLIDELDQFFFHFDSVVDKYNIEKIKTIGDAYMAAGGIPRKNRSNPVEVVLAALEMQGFMKHLQKTRVDFWDLRIGIHTGPVIAGIVGHKKRSYDIWGDTVNIASRMESSGKAGKVNVSGETYLLVKDYFLCDYRGKVPVKYKGNLDMYFVRGLRPELSINLESLPNRKFYLRLQILRLVDLEEHVFDILQEESPKSLYFHTAEYAHHLYNYADLISKAENLDLDETILIRTAALLIPLGYLENYNNPEAASSALAIKLLPEFQYSERQIRQISNLILSSNYPPEPSNLLEQIMVDMRYEYLGRADFGKMYKLLFLERNEYLENMEARIWKDQLISFLESFQYYTTGAKRLCEISFEKQIQKIRDDEKD